MNIQRMNIHRMFIYYLSNILLSIILFNLAYLLPDYFGFTVLLFWIPLFFVIEKVLSAKKAFFLGLCFGLGSYSIHFIWFFILLLTKTFTTFWQALGIYLFVVLIFALTSGVCFSILFFLKKMYYHILVWWFYFLFLANYFFKILDKNIKYPFILPTVPLASFKLFLKFYAFICFPFGNPNQISFDKLESFKKQIFHVSPDTDEAYKTSYEEAAKRLYCKISDLKAKNNLENSDKATFFLAPESTFPFVLSNRQDAVSAISKSLQEKEFFMLGSFREESGKFFQTIYLISQGRIIQTYDKTILVPGTEKLPKFWRKHFAFIEELFLKGKRKLSKGKSSKKYFDLVEDFKIVPKVCSEFFWQVDRQIEGDVAGPKVLLAFINDSWFCSYFKKLMQNYTKVRAVKSGLPVFYIGFENIELFI